MTIENDETLQIYLEESLEHLANIENDFLAIERAGADINEELVNKVYRAAHSIKGGAGFMGLTIIKDLTHEMENILGKIRSRELVPNPEIINILLMASDALKALIEDVMNSNDADISQHIEALKSITSGHVAQEEEPTDAPTIPQPTVSQIDEQIADEDGAAEGEKRLDSDMIDVWFPDGKYVLHVSNEELSAIRNDGKHVYLIEMDLVHDVHSKGKSPLEFTVEMQSCGVIVDYQVDMDAIGTVEHGAFIEQIPIRTLYATILKPNDINKLFEIEEQGIYEFTEDMSVIPISGPAMSKAAVPPLSKPAVLEGDSPESSDEIQKAEEVVPKDIPAASTRPEPARESAITKEKRSVKKRGESVPDLAAATGQKQEKEILLGMGGPETSLRVHVSLLDSLMNLAGELVLSRNQLIQAISSCDKHASEIAAQRVNLITSELQEAIMLTRMQAIGNVFSKFPRVVRDLARKLGKEVELTLEGNEVEMDKTIIEAISDPLTHLIRNSVDHGIERPHDRMKAGKDPKGHVKLKAYHEAGQVNIEIIDDGAGLNGKKLASTAVTKGLITEEQSATMSEKERINLIFLPGFSTAKEVTDVSGRGVGMDVVKTNLDKLGGVVDVNSKLGMGTSIRIKLPLTLAIIPSQIIVTGGERYAIPQVNLEELLRIPASQIKNRIEKVGNAEVLRLRGTLLPLVKLADLIGIEKTYLNPKTDIKEADRRKGIADRRCKKSPPFYASVSTERPSGDESEPEPEDKRVASMERRYHAASALNIVVLSTGTMKYGLVVDELLDSEEIVVKPLGRHLKHSMGYAGATIMGDGKVALILDVSNLAQMAELTCLGGTDRAAEVSREAAREATAKQDKQSLLVFRSADDEQFVVPLNQVERIEKIKKAQIEEVGGKKVLQYRGGSLPLFSIDQVTNVKPIDDREKLLIIVFNITGRGVGLMAMGPVDVMELFAQFDERTIRQPGILGSAIIEGHTTLLVSIYDIVRILNPEWFAGQKTEKAVQGEAPSVLVVEDSNFFRNQVKSYMKDEGYNVVEAGDGVEAWDFLNEHPDEISLVCTDIEMPNLDGFGLTERIRADDRFLNLPVIALTTLAADADVKGGKAVGIDEYHIKLDKERLMDSVRRSIKNGRSA